MAINSLQVAWISRLADKKVIRPGDSILEFGPQDLCCGPAVVELYGSRHRDTAFVKQCIGELFDGDRPRPVVPSTFYRMFGTQHYRSLDLSDPRSDWLRDCNEPFVLPERFDVVTNFGTAEHVFNIGTMFRSVHDALKPGGVAIHILPAFGDINHGFYNIHPTVYLDLAAANGYAVEDFCYVDRWDIRNRIFETDIKADFDFDSLPIDRDILTDRSRLQRAVVDLYAANYNDAKTKQYGEDFPGRLYDYCLVALRRMTDQPFRYPVQGIYGGGIAPASSPLPYAASKFLTRGVAIPSPKTVAKAVVRRFVLPAVPESARRLLVRRVLKSVLRDLVFHVTGKDLGLSAFDRAASHVFSRPNYPAPPLDGATLDRMMTLVESRVERLYENVQMTATINDLSPEFLAQVKSVLAAEPEFVSFFKARYRQRDQGTPAHAKAVNDLAGLV